MPPGVGPLESSARGSGRVRLYPRDHSGQHRLAFCGRYTMGGNRSFRGRGRCPQLRHDPDIYFSRSDLKKAEAARKSFDEKGNAVPSTRSIRRRFPPDTQRTGSQAAAPQECLPEARRKGLELDGWPGWGSKTMVKRSSRQHFVWHIILHGT